MIQGLYTVDEVNKMIEKGDALILAGDLPLLSALRSGKWIAGATSRFIENGKSLVSARDKIFVHNITGIAASVKLKVYDVSTVQNIYDDAFDNGFSVMIMPFGSEIEKEYAIHCTNYSNFACRAVCGWVAVTSLYSDYERDDKSIVYFGETGKSFTNSCVVIHIELPSNKYAEIHAFSPFVPKEDSDIIIFDENCQQVENVLINGEKTNFRKYLIDKNIDRTIRAESILAGDHHSGLIMNISLALETEFDKEKFVSFGGPVYKGIPYRFAKIDEENTYNIKGLDGEIVYSLSCITNFVCPEVFMKYLTQTNGPFVYGEIAYFLLNNATVFVTVGNISD